MRDKTSLIDRQRVASLPTPQRIFLFLSCTGSIEYPGTERALRFVAQALGIELAESAEQTCCSGYMFTCNSMQPLLAAAAAARNLSIPERLGLDVATFCNGCYGYLRELSQLALQHPAYRSEVAALLREMDRSYTGGPRIYHVQELWYKQLDRLVALQRRSLCGLRIGVHYGCHYLADRESAIDDASYPTFLEEMVAGFGAQPVFYEERRACCGYSVGRGFTHRDSVVLRHLEKKMASAAAAGVELLVTTCPGCNVALDREQPALRERGVPAEIPVIDLSQLVAFALGAPLEQLGFAANTTPVLPTLKKYAHCKAE